MKKFLITGAFTLALSAFLFSCADDDNDFSSIAEMKQATFAENFVKFYGPIDPNQDWGFGTTTPAATRMTRGISDYVGYKGSMKPTFNFPTAPNESDYAQSKQGNPTLLTGYMDGNNFYIDASVSNNGKNLQPNGNNIVLYVEGTVVPTDIYTPANTTIYLLPNSKLTIPSNRKSFGQNNTRIYIASGAELIIQGDFVEFGYGVKVYNKGKITASNIRVSNNGLLYNQGTIDLGTGYIKALNNQSVIVNDNTLKAGYLGTEGSGCFQNNAETTISGNTIVNSNNNTWVNNGHYITENFFYTATSSEVINNCRLTVNEDFGMNIADGSGVFKVDGGGSVETKNFYGGGDFAGKDQYGNNANFQGGPFRVDLGSKSLFKVSNIAMLNALASGIVANGYGFHGVGEDYAVFQAKDIRKSRVGEGNVVYGGRLYVSAETHFAQGKSGNYPFIHYQNGCSEANVYAPGFSSGKPDITIESTPCNPGFPTGYVDDGKLEKEELGPGTETKKKRIEIKTVLDHKRVFCEDLGSSSNRKDYDYNDVVFDAKIIESYYIDEGSSTPYGTNWYAEIEVLAAGGELSLTVGGVQVNDLFNELPSMIINTVSAEDDETFAASHNAFNNPYSPKKFIYEFNSLEEATIANIPVIAKAGNTAIYLQAKKGEAPQKICVPVGTLWPYERVAIDEAYGKFAHWVGHANDFTPDEIWGDSINVAALYPNLGTETAEEIGSVYRNETEIGGNGKTFTFNPEPSVDAAVWDYADEGGLALSSAPIRISKDNFENAVKGTIVRLYGVDEGNGDITVMAGDVALGTTTRSTGMLYKYTLSTAQAVAAKEKGLAITGYNFKLYYVTVEAPEEDVIEYVEPTFGANDFNDKGNLVSGISQQALTSTGITVAASIFTKAGAGTEVYVYGSGDASTVSVSVDGSNLTSASRATRAIIERPKDKKIVKFTMNADQAKKAQTEGVKITGSNFTLHAVSVKIVEEQVTPTPTPGGEKAGQIWPDSGAGSAVSNFTIVKSKFTNDMVGKTLRVYCSEFGGWWGLTLRLVNAAGDIFSGLNVPNWTNNTSHLATAINSAAKNGSCIEMALSQDLINLFKAYDVELAPVNLKITNVTVE